MFHGHAIERVRNTLATRPVHNIVAGYKAGTPFGFRLWRTDEQFLQAVASDFGCLLSDASSHWSIPAPSFPPLRIFSRQVISRLGGSAVALPNLVSRHQ